MSSEADFLGPKSFRIICEFCYGLIWGKIVGNRFKHIVGRGSDPESGILVTARSPRLVENFLAMTQSICLQRQYLFIREKFFSKNSWNPSISRSIALRLILACRRVGSMRSCTASVQSRLIPLFGWRDTSAQPPVSGWTCNHIMIYKRGRSSWERGLKGKWGFLRSGGRGSGPESGIFANARLPCLVENFLAMTWGDIFRIIGYL